MKTKPMNILSKIRLWKLYRQGDRDWGWRKLGRLEGRKEATDEMTGTIKFAVKQAMREWEESKKI